MTTEVRKGQGPGKISRSAFATRFRARFSDPAFDGVTAEIDDLLNVAWDVYQASRKSPRTRKAGADFADPSYDLSVEWLGTRHAIEAAQAAQQKPSARSRILLICASPRNDDTCPGEMSKSYRIALHVSSTFEDRNCEVDFLDLSLLTSEYGRTIYPCKACVSTAMPLCHWPCSCYPNHDLGQVNDWMNEIYPRWVAAHGVMIITPVHWYQAPSTLKLMIDRLVCADGGNPDPTTTHGKDPVIAKNIEAAGWHYPRPLAGRAFALLVHGDAAGVESLKHHLSDWLTDMGLIEAGSRSVVDRYIGYYEPYYSSHDSLDADRPLWEEARNASVALFDEISLIRNGREEPGDRLTDPRPK